MTSDDGSRRSAVVLLVEDNEDDVLLTRLGFEQARFTVNLHHVENGLECMRFLQHEGEHADKPRPDLILLDLNMPVMDGWQVLERISASDDLRHIPVVILTTSSHEADVLKSYQLRCSSYIVKPVDFDKFAEVIREVTEYWFTIVVLPRSD